MSIRNLSVLGRLSHKKINNALWSTRHFSRKTKNTEEPYVTIKSKRTVKNETRLARLDPNFELLASTTGFPFILPGNVGMAWYDTNTTAQSPYDFVMEQLDEPKTITDGDIICRIQSCPTVLRKDVYDLFPYRDLETSELSVVTISLKPNLKLLRKNNELETERMAQTFVITAKGVCDKLRNAGYWADFINPFSGRPYLYPTSGEKLYEADEKFRCLDFQIFDIQDCKIVSNEQDSSKRRFIGSLFTNAPSKKKHLNDIFTQF
ncbi:methylmalonic aciduria and homocystinuria type D homolog, mitochondrial-like isoform X2 [Tenebrio molitor]|uniref:methylmalonic aciduria and homocystinuria type D homolog, mitochondrial-like isoform X2 n=1 Tax=Tenebrio molitor TaxID=7067 RepID=UPI0036247851